MVNSIAPLRNLITAFLAQDLSPEGFERDYLRAFKEFTAPLSREEERAFEELFFDVDAYCGDPDLRDADDLDEDGLRRSAERCLERLGLANAHSDRELRRVLLAAVEKRVELTLSSGETLVVRPEGCSEGGLTFFPVDVSGPCRRMELNRIVSARPLEPVDTASVPNSALDGPLREGRDELLRKLEAAVGRSVSIRLNAGITIDYYVEALTDDGAMVRTGDGEPVVALAFDRIARVL